jgi:hypothetical protein
VGSVGGESIVNFYCKLRNRSLVYMRGFFGIGQIGGVSISVMGYKFTNAI